MDVGGLLVGPGSAMIESITSAAVAPSSFAAAAVDVIGERADEDPSDTFPPEAAVAGVTALFVVPAVPADRPRASIPALAAPATAGTAAAATARA